MTKTSAGLDNLLDHVQRTRGFDFSGYKPTTLERRIQRRMTVVGAADYAAYLEVLKARPDEFGELFNAILINVTSFFRDPEVWDAIDQQFIPQILARKDDSDAIRVWSAGCSTGQEAYTVAMLFAERLGKDGAARRVKVYATDVNDDALRQARQARYAPEALEPLPPGFRDKYFDAVAGRFELRKDVRRCVIFGKHDLIHDAPISRIDLLLCRNTIMYLNAQTQEHIVARLHFALAPRGVLVLGQAEMLLSHPELFSVLDLKRRAFAKASTDGAAERIPIRMSPKLEPAHAHDAGLSRLRMAAFDASPVAQIIVDAAGLVVQISRRAREIFGLTEHDQRRPLQDLEVSYRPVELRSVLEQAYAKGSAVVLSDVEQRRGGDTRHYEVQVTPLIDRENAAPLGAGISFIDITQPTRLQHQLRRTHAELQTAFEQLQSTSEELETTNEELQSTNESQEALTAEVRTRSTELTSANLSLEAILATLRSAVVVVDPELKVTTWSSRAEDLWGVRPDEAVGKDLLSLDVGLPVDKLVPKIRACFEGEDVPEAVLEATNRRGRPISCKIACLRLAGGKEREEVRRVVLVLGEVPGEGRDGEKAS